METKLGHVNRFTAIGATPIATIWFVYGLHAGSTPVPGYPGLTIGIASPEVAGSSMANSDGVASFDRFVPQSAWGRTVLFEAVNQQHCLTTRIITTTFD